MSDAEMREGVTIGEHIASLKRSFIPTVVVEGSDDIVVYRYIEEIYGPINISVLPVGGRDAVLAIYAAKAEIGNHVFFIADRDTWCVTSVPACYEDKSLVFTDGYSIENDVILDGDIPKLFRRDEKQKFEKELDDFLEWYALALSRHLQAEEEAIKSHPNAILDNAAQRASMLELRPSEVYPDDLKLRLKADPFRLVRGKSLFALIIRQLSRKGRKPKQHHLSLMETVAAAPGPRINKIFKGVEAYFELG